jgi:hypothetical protein
VAQTYPKSPRLILDVFETYLIKRGYHEITPSGLGSTTYDYARVRIPYVLRVEKIELIELMMDRWHYVELYGFGGEKEHLGNQSHRAVISALRRFAEFCDIEIFVSEYH